jgi:hypothetical protein
MPRHDGGAGTGRPLGGLDDLPAEARSRLREEVAAGRVPEGVDPALVAAYAAHWRGRWPLLFLPLPFALAAVVVALMALIGGRVLPPVAAIGFGVGLLVSAAQLTHGRNKLIRAERAARATAVAEGGAADLAAPPAEVPTGVTLLAVAAAIGVGVALFAALA